MPPIPQRSQVNPAAIPAKAKISFQPVPAKKGQRVLLYGTGGVGKTTLACLLEKTAFIDLDESLPILKGQLESIGAEIPLTVACHNWTEIRVALQSEGWDKVKNIVIDTATKLEEFAAKYTFQAVKTDGGKAASSIEDYGYGKGYGFVFDTFQLILGDLDRHVREGRNVILIAHECTTNVPNPAGQDWLRYEPRLQSPNSGKASIRHRLKEWCDHVLFLTYDVNVEADKKGGKAKAQGCGTRTLYTAELPFCMAKSRTTSDQFSIEHGVSPWAGIIK